MQAIGEGFEILEKGPFDLDLEKVAGFGIIGPL